MMSQSPRNVAVLVLLVAFVKGSVLNSGYGGGIQHEPRVFEDHPDWLGDKKDGYSVGYSEKHFQIFTHIMTFMKYQQDVDTKQFLDLYKFFVKSVWNLRRQNTPWGYQEQYEKVFYGEVHAQQTIENWNEICDELEGNDKEEKTKRLFMVYLRFRTHYFEQKKIYQNMKGDVVEKTRKQFSLFLELVAYAEKAHYIKKQFKQFCKYAEVRLKVQYSYFKRCVFQSYCEKLENVKVSVHKKVGVFRPSYNIDDYSGRDSHQYDKAGNRYGLFNKAQKYVRMISNNHHYDNDHDAYIDWNHIDEDEYQKDKHPVIAFIVDLHTYLSDHGPRDFWDSKSYDGNEGRQKFLFFATRAYREIQDQRYLREKRAHPQERFAHFTNFLDHQEDGPGALRDFDQFQNWHGVEENRIKLVDFEDFLRNLAVVKRYPLGYGEKAGYGGYYAPFGNANGVGYGGHFGPLGYGGANVYGGPFFPLGYLNVKGIGGPFSPLGYGGAKGFGGPFSSFGYDGGYRGLFSPLGYNDKFGSGGYLAPTAYGAGHGYGGYFSPLGLGHGKGFGGVFVPVGHGGYGHGFGGPYARSGYGSRNGYGGHYGYGKGAGFGGLSALVGYGDKGGYGKQYGPLAYNGGHGYGGLHGPSRYVNENGYGGHYGSLGYNGAHGSGGYAPFLAFRNHLDDGELYRDEVAMKEEYYKQLYNRLRFYRPQYESSSYKNIH